MLSREEQDLEIRIAMACAAEGDPWDMIAHLQRVNVLSGIKLTFRRKWPDLPEAEIDDMVARGVDALYDKLSRGGEVANPVGYVLEVMRHEAYDYAAGHGHTVPLDAARDSISTDDVAGAAMPDDRRAAALASARSIIPRLGQDSVQAVMRLIVDAVEDGRTTITTTELAAATGLTEESVRQCRSRGFRRLERIVREEGLAPALTPLPRTDAPARTGRSG